MSRRYNFPCGFRLTCHNYKSGPCFKVMKIFTLQLHFFTHNVYQNPIRPLIHDTVRHERPGKVRFRLREKSRMGPSGETEGDERLPGTGSEEEGRGQRLLRLSLTDAIWSETAMGHDGCKKLRMCFVPLKRTPRRIIEFNLDFIKFYLMKVTFTLIQERYSTLLYAR